MIVQAALEEDVDVVGLSSLSGEHLSFTPKVVELLKEKRLGDTLLIMGGVIPTEDIPRLKEMGVAEVFTAGSLTEPIVEFIRNRVRKS
jgi:methylmalonyl-CoA mutase C-terminal domain/subunit